MAQSRLPTEFAPAERVPEDEIQSQSLRFPGSPLACQLLSSVPDILMVLNAQRQIVYANRALYDLLGLKETDTDKVLGRRQGEVLSCAHAFESEGGCGTTKFCSTCGAMRAILSSQKMAEDVRECRIIQDQPGEALDLRVWARPIKLERELFTAFSAVDIRHEKRRQALERIFFHDVLNTAGGLKGSVELFSGASVEELEEFQHIISHLSDELIDEIKVQRELAAAERDELALNPVPVKPVVFLREVADLYANHEVASGRQVRVDSGAWDGVFYTDRTLLRRVVGNMTKNALEASKSGETVSLGCDREDNGIAFWVHNPAVMPQDVQLQIFQRSFSTKGAGRGLGTYSIKLLTERYLMGSVSFTSLPGQGTTFRVCCPDLQPGGTSDASPVEEPPKTTRGGLHILLAEDNPVNQRLAVRLLEKQGHVVVAVDNGRAAVDAIEGQQFDMVLMDMEMPEMNGFEATAAIRKREVETGEWVPIVALTAHAMAGDQARCLAAGMDGYVAKPIQREEMFRVIGELVS